MADFCTRDDGSPTAAHMWDEQFKALRDNGYKGPPPAETLSKRIEQLAEMVKAFPEHKAAGGWRREILWRRKQLLILKEADNGDPERQE